MSDFTDAIQSLWPHCPDALMQGIVDSADDVLAKYELNTWLRQVHFGAQVSHECQGGTITHESLFYTHAERIHAVWPSRFPTIESATPFVRDEKALADRVYNGRMGNAPGTEDGFNFRGRGLLQLTGRESYTKIGELTGLDLANQPDLVLAPENAMLIAAAEFAHLGAPKYADLDDLTRVTERVNGGRIGLDQRKAWLIRWKKTLPAF